MTDAARLRLPVGHACPVAGRLKHLTSAIERTVVPPKYRVKSARSCDEGAGPPLLLDSRVILGVLTSVTTKEAPATMRDFSDQESA